MLFKFLSLSALASLIAAVSAQFCPEASRFGIVSVSPTTVSPGQTYTITANLTCAVQLGDTPTYLDYYIEGTSTHALPGPMLVARRTYNHSASPPIDKFTAVLPNWYYYTDALYSLMMWNSFARPGPTGESVISVGGIGTGITITGF
ncbi:hypothetical protein DFH06DRAFT_769621 [Mycena polygramma]|nr:hypothetical protein DFH06DRAFT_769621 [Mycena polygramma]